MRSIPRACNIAAGGLTQVSLVASAFAFNANRAGKALLSPHRMAAPIQPIGKGPLTNFDR